MGVKSKDFTSEKKLFKKMTNPSDMWMISWTWEMLSVPVVGPFTLYLYTIIIPADNSITHTSENTNV